MFKKFIKLTSHSGYENISDQLLAQKHKLSVNDNNLQG